VASVREQQSIQETLRLMRDQLTAMQEDAELLISRLEHQPGALAQHTDACQTIIDQTHQIELALVRLVATTPHVLCDA
jgi:hypothetical protein